MSYDSQQQCISFLSDPDTHGTQAPVTVIRTHAAILFLAGQTAYKIKQAVKYTYLDFSTLDRRHDVLLRELELNKSAAPKIYRDVIAITAGKHGGLELNGEGAVVEWALRLNRFPAKDELSQMAERGAFSMELAAALGREIATYHQNAPVIRRFSGSELIREILDELIKEFRPMTDVLSSASITAFHEAADAALSSCTGLLNARSADGDVRRGHGDLHLRNIVCMDGAPVLFDALEFDEKLGTMDVLYDLAFLIMDMLRSGLRLPANIAFNRYLYHSDHIEHLTGLSALPLFLSVRAAIRAMVEVQVMRAATSGSNRTNCPVAETYLSAALAYLKPPQPQLIAVGGLSGTGKTTLAQELAPDIGAAPGAVHLRSDLERKAMFGVEEFSPLPSEAYSEAAGNSVYARLNDKAQAALKGGHSVVLDAVHMTPDQRNATRRLAENVKVPFVGLWLIAEPAKLIQRVSSRQRDASDATENVVRQQLNQDFGHLDWTNVDASGRPETTAKNARALIHRLNAL